MPREDDPRFGPGGQYAAKPGGTDYAPPPQLTLEAARNFEAYDRARVQEWTSAHPSPGRALEPWQTEDRIAYNKARQEQEEEARRLDDELKRQQEFERYRQARSSAAELARRRFGINPLGIIPRAQRVANAGEQYTAIQDARANPPTGEAAGLLARNDAAGLALYNRASAPDATQQDLELYQEHLAQHRDPATFGERAIANAQAFDARVGRTLASPLKPVTERIPGGGIAQSFAEEGLRPSSIAAMFVPLAKGPAATRILQNALRQGGANVAIDLLLGRTDPQQLALSAGLGAAGGAALPELGNTIKAIRAFGESPEGQRVLRTLQNERGALTLGPGEDAAKAAAGEQFRAKLDEYRHLYGSAAEQKMAEDGLFPHGAAPASGQAGAEALGLGQPAAALPPDQAGTDLATRLARPASTNSALTPPEHQELINALHSIIPTAAEKRAELTAGRARQFGNRQQAINAALAAGKSNKEALQAGKSAMAGDILTRRNIIGAFTDARVDGYYGDIRVAELAGRISSPESIAAKNGLDLLTDGARSNGNTGPVMKHEADAMARVFGPGIRDALPMAPAQMTAFQKWFAPVQIYRSWKTGFDDSFGFGQGWKVMLSDKGAWARGKAAGWRAALGDENTAESIMEALRQNSPTFIRGQSADRPLAIMTTGAGTNPAEEFMSPVTRRIPLLSRSERSFVVGGSVMRQLALDRKAMLWERANPGETVPDDVFQRMIDMVNEGTNWGHLSEKFLGDWKSPVSQMLFSAHAKAALFQYPITLVKAMAPGADPTLRKMAAYDFAAWILGNGAVLGTASGMAALAGYVGYNVPGGTGAQTNPFGKNFGQIKFGPQRIDIWQGASPLVRLVIQSAMAASKGEWKTPGKLGLNYSRNQLSPSFAIPADYVIGGGKNTVGVSQGSGEYWANAASPLFISDTVESLRLLGFPLGLPGAVLSFEGMRVNTYGNNAAQDATAAKVPIEKAMEQAGYDPNFIYTQKYGQDKLKAQIGGDPSKYASLSEYRAAYVEEVAKILQKPKSEGGEGLTLARARQTAGERFDAAPIIDEISKAHSEYRMNWWKAHPDLAQQAADTGVEKFTPKQRKELGIK